ncbi:MAG: tyrosine-type recombinase/integrase [Pseudomonadota bacterium]
MISRLQTASESLQLGRVVLHLPAAIADEGPEASKRFFEFFTANIRNKNTREAYGRAVRDFFAWCDRHDIGPLVEIEAIHVAAYIELMTDTHAPQTVKQRLAAIKAMFDYLVIGGIPSGNPASAVRGPKHSQLKGKTPVLMADDARDLIRSIDTSTKVGLRDLAIIGVMTYGFARVSAALSMDVIDVFMQRRRLWIRLTEKGGKYHEMPCHHNLEVYLQEYIDAAGLADSDPIFQSFRGKSGRLTGSRLNRQNCFHMIKRRAQSAGTDLPKGICNHTFRGTGITAYLSNPDARLERAQQMAAHSDPKTTRMYDRRSDELSLDEVEKIGI